MASSRRLPASYNISTYGVGGQGRDYTSLATWEIATDNDLVSAANGEVLECYDDASTFNDGDNLDGAVTDADYFRVIKPAAGEGHDGTPNNGVNFTGKQMRINENYSQMHDLIVNDTVIDQSSCHIGGTEAAFVGCISSAASGGACFSCNPPTNGKAYFIDCLAYGGAEGFWCIGDKLYAYNCTAADVTTGFLRTSGTATAKNCCSCDNTTDFSGTWSQTTNYAGDDTVFVNQAGDDYHLAAGDTTCRGNGTDLSADGTYAFDDDIDGDTRSAWDIGFDEFQVSGWANISKVNTVGEANIGSYTNIAKDNIAVIDSIPI